MKPLILLTDELDPKIVKRKLGPHARFRAIGSRPKLLAALPAADALVTLVRDPVDEELLSRARRLKVVGNVATGIDNIDLAACRRHGVRVVRTPGAPTRATAELALALLLAAARRFHEGERLARDGRWKGWEPGQLLGIELEGRTAVIVGKGSIGTELARLFRGIGLKVRFITRKTSAAGIRKLLRQADVLSMNTPMNPATRHWLDARKLALLPREAIVINTSRGPVVDERALIRALESGRIFAAGLDVYEREPEIPAELRRLPNVVLLPHLGSATRKARAAMIELALDGVLGVLRGKRPWNEVVS
ncbi:MAG TPA: NAD(P)-dependent oxidoreductase [Bdellovibrionota bacterium]|nr:NAD(P)-dependent oxidoreductase [Bdellovibrionota bacterium]